MPLPRAGGLHGTDSNVIRRAACDKRTGPLPRPGSGPLVTGGREGAVLVM
jgi:hypothetical protein